MACVTTIVKLIELITIRMISGPIKISGRPHNTSSNVFLRIVFLQSNQEFSFPTFVQKNYDIFLLMPCSFGQNSEIKNSIRVRNFDYKNYANTV